MKKVIIVLILLTFIKMDLLYAQVIFSNGTGGGLWTETATWLGGSVPGLSNDVVIQGTDSVLTGTGAQCANLTIQSGGKIATSADEVVISNNLTVEANAIFYNRTESPTLPGNTIVLDQASTVVHMGSGTVGGPGNLEFGNLIIQRTAGSTANGNLIIYGDLTVNNAGHNQYFRGVDDDSEGPQEHTIHGNVYVMKGTWSCVDVGAPDAVGIWNVMGDVYVYGSGPNPPTGVAFDARIGPFSSANADGLGIFNIAGDLIIDGGRLHAATSSSAGTGTAIMNLGGGLTLTANSAVSTNHLGPFSLNFVGSGSQTVTFERTFSMSTDVYDTVKAGSNVVFNLADSVSWNFSSGGGFVVEGALELPGTATLSGNGTFTLNSGGTLKIGSPDGISTSGTTGNVQVTGTRTYSEEANYEYKGTGAQSLGNGLPSTVNGFAVHNPNGIILDRNLTVNSSVNIINGDLDLNGNIVTLGENAALTESSGNTVSGSSGLITTTRNIGTPSELNVGGLGAVLTAGNDLGNTTVERFHSAAAGNGNHGILRRYNISPGQNNSGLNATLRINYDDSELNGLNESGLRIYKSPDGSDNSWENIGGNVNTTDNYVEVSGITDFSHWTIADIGSTLPVEEETNYTPTEFALHQNYPNPFNPETTIRFELPSESFVNITIFNAIGEEVANLINEQLGTGVYSVSFNGENLSSGLYFYRLSTGSKVFMKKMMLLK